MRILIPSETALVLGGGGAKGAYQIGAMRALNDLGIACGSVYGASIGALNAAMYAQGELARAAALWQSLTLDDLVTPEDRALADNAEALFGHPERMLDFITRHAQKKGIDTAPLRALIGQYADEGKIRQRTVRLGLITTRFPSMQRVEKRLHDMEEGSLTDWLMASSACFPVFPMVRIGEDRYMDGGFCDNVPVDMAILDGAKHVIAIDIGRSQSHTQYEKRPNVTYIRTSQPLGGLLTFDPEVSRRNEIIGYHDTMRAFGHMRGTRYAFDPVDAQALYARAQDFVARLSQTDVRLQQSGLLIRGNDAPLISCIEETLVPGADAIDYFLRACEICAEIAQVNPAQAFTFDAFCEELRARLPLAKAEAMLDGLLGGRIGVLFSPPYMDRRLVISCLYHLLMRESFTHLALRTLAAFPREMLCAITLKEII